MLVQTKKLARSVQIDAYLQGGRANGPGIGFGMQRAVPRSNFLWAKRRYSGLRLALRKIHAARAGNETIVHDKRLGKLPIATQANWM